MHSNRLVLHHVFGRLPASVWDDAETPVEAALQSVPNLTAEILERIISEVDRLYRTCCPASLFKNASRGKSVTA